MSETTNKMRDVAIYSDSLIRVRDLAADAIEAVEAQVAEAAKRHEDLAAWCAETEARVAALEKRQGKDGAQVASSGCASVPVAVAPESTASPAAPVRRFLPGDRVRFVKEPRCTGGYLGSFGTVESIVGWPIFFDYDIKSDTCGENGYHVKADDSDLEPAPSAVPAPRGFREGDIVRIKRTANGHEGWHGQEGPLVRDGIGLRPKLRFKGIGEPLVVAFHPHEYDLVRAAAAPEAPAEDAGLVERLAEVIWRLPGATGHWADLSEPERLRFQRDAVGVLATLRAEGRLCAPGEVTRLTAERDKAREFHDLAEGDLRKWIDRCNERDKDVSDLRAKHLTLEARAEAAEKERDEARAISDSMTARVRSETQIATELRKDLADANDRLTSQSRSIEEMHAEMVDLRAKLAAAEQALDVERRTSIDHDGKTFVHPTREARLTSTAESWSPWMKHHKRVEAERDALRAELAALKAKPRFRTRKVTAKDVGAWEEEWCKDSYGAGERHKAMNALGFRRRVDGGK